jgi:carbon storage regulator CsrA
MLVLSRKSHEAVVVGDTPGSVCRLKVTVLEIGHGIVRLGFEAGTDMFIHRLEVWERVRAACPPVHGADAGTLAPDAERPVGTNSPEGLA